jgi:hypothetical protein
LSSLGRREKIESPLPIRVRVSDPSLLADLCDFLSRRGYVAVEVSEEEAQVLSPGAPSEFEALTMLMSEVGIWRATRAEVQVLVEADDGGAAIEA